MLTLLPVPSLVTSGVARGSTDFTASTPSDSEVVLTPDTWNSEPPLSSTPWFRPISVTARIEITTQVAAIEYQILRWPMMSIERRPVYRSLPKRAKLNIRRPSHGRPAGWPAPW